MKVYYNFQTEYPRFENGRYVYRIHRSPMCEYMINFIHKLKHLPEKYMMNSVLENFTILQVSDIQMYILVNYNIVWLILLAGLQSNSGLWIDVCPSVCQHLVNLCVKVCCRSH